MSIKLWGIQFEEGDYFTRKNGSHGLFVHKIKFIRGAWVEHIIGYIYNAKPLKIERRRGYYMPIFWNWNEFKKQTIIKIDISKFEMRGEPR